VILRTPADCDRLALALKAKVANGPREVTDSAWKPSRSNEQNAYLFGVCYPPIAEAKGYSVEDVHAFMCGTHFGWVDKPCPKTPRNPEGLESVPFRSTTRNHLGARSVLSKSEFSEFIATVQRIAAMAGVYIPDAEAA
jgi:hypothetical protein